MRLIDSVLPAHPAMVGEVRRQMYRVLARARITAVRDDALLIVTELLTNAVRYTERDIRVRVAYREPVLRIEVFDDSGHPPRLQEPGADAEGGRGLALVAAAAAQWGTNVVPGGKIVWAELRVDNASQD